MSNHPSNKYCYIKYITYIITHQIYFTREMCDKNETIHGEHAVADPPDDDGAVSVEINILAHYT